MQIKTCIKQELVIIRITFVANMRELNTKSKLHTNINFIDRNTFIPQKSLFWNKRLFLIEFLYLTDVIMFNKIVVRCGRPEYICTQLFFSRFRSAKCFFEKLTTR